MPKEKTALHQRIESGKPILIAEVSPPTGGDPAPLLEVAREMAQEDGLDENVRAIVDSILRSSRHRFGRYLETLRRE